MTHATASYERIDYAVRPAKHVERKMIVDALGRLRHFGALEEYRYVGFGSTYFTDFTLFHRRLGIKHLVSIEADEHKKARFEFNKPLGFIDLRFGLSTAVLPELNWTQRSIVWLDYDGMLDRTVLADLEYVCASATSGSVVMVTVNAHPNRREKDQLNALIERVGEGAVPLGTTGADLAEWGLAAIGRRIIDGRIRDFLRDRGVHPHRSAMNYRQLFNFRYQDSAMMNTVGGIVFDEGHRSHLGACGFGDFPFVSYDERFYLIQMPKLTLHEQRYLAGNLPIDLDAADLNGIPPEDVLRYSALYRYFPTFVDADL